MIMTHIILIFGILVFLGGIIILVTPDLIISIFRKYKNSFCFHFIAIIARIILGIVLIIGSHNSKYPLILQILGWLTLAAVLVLILMGRNKFIKMIEWTIELPQPLKRIMGFFGIFFGCFLIYAVI